MNIDILNKEFKSCLLITSKSNKDLIIKESFRTSKILNFKLVDIKEAESLFLPYIDPICEYYIFKETQNKILSRNIYKTLKYISNKNYTSKKLNYIKEIYIDLKEKNLIKDKINYNNFNKVFSTEKGLEYIIDDIEYIELNDNNLEQKEMDVAYFPNINEEISFALNDISNLIYEGIDTSLIKIYAPSTYKDNISLISKYFNLDIFINSRTSIKSIPYIDELLFFMNKNKTIDIYEFKDIDKISNEIINDILSVINKNIFIDDINYIISEIEEIKVNNLHMKDALEIKDILNFDFNKKNFNFILGFDNLNFIKIKKDDGYINDLELKELRLPSSIEENSNNNKKISLILKVLSNASYFISCSKVVKGIETGDNHLLESKFINKKNTNILLKKEQYSLKLDSVNFKIEENKFFKYNYSSDAYNILKKNIKQKDIPSNQMSKIKWNRNYFKENKNISSTMLESYFKCPFSFYIKYVLNIKKVSKNRFNLDLGIYIHDLLEKLLLDNSVNINDLSNEIIENNNLFLNIKENKINFITFKVKRYILELIKTINLQIAKEDFKVKFLEEEIITLFKGYNFVGKIDKVLNYNDMYMVIDYKTGNSELSFENIELGFNMQNLIYFILLKKKYKNVEFAGTYRYKVAPKIVSKEKFSLPKREGYTKKELEILKSIDIDNYNNLKISKGEFSKSSKVLDKEEFQQKEKIVNENINKFIYEIENQNSFEITDIILKGEHISCKYCDYNNICFKSKNNIINK